MTITNNKTLGNKTGSFLSTNKVKDKTTIKTNIGQKTSNKKTAPKTIIKTKTKIIKTKNSPTKYANHPDYEFDTIKKRWIKKSIIRPINLINRYKLFLIQYLKNTTSLNHKEIEKLVKKHATSTKRLREILVKKGVMTIDEADDFFYDYSFWSMELCKSMKKICPTETDLGGIDWCEYDEDAFLYHKEKTTGHISCYSIDDISGIISSSLTGGDEYTLLLQPPRDPYTRKVLSEDIIKSLLRQIRYLKESFSNYGEPHVVYFLRHYKKFYKDPQIKPFLNKTTLTSQEKTKLSNAIQDFLTRTNELRLGRAKQHIRWWFWVDGKEPKHKGDYIYNI